MNLGKYIRRTAAALALAIPLAGVAGDVAAPVPQVQSSGRKMKKAPATSEKSVQPKQDAAAEATRKKGAKKKKGVGKKMEDGKKKGAGQAAAEPVKSRYWALKVNVPYAAAVVQNLEFEAQVARKWTVALPVMWSVSDLKQDCGLRTIALQPEARWWEGRRLGEGHFVGFHANLAWFNLKWDDTRYQARHTPLMGAGISYGYKLPLSAHWGAEFSLGVGYAYMKYDMFYNIDNGAKRGTGSRHYFGLDRLAVSLVYRF